MYGLLCIWCVLAVVYNKKRILSVNTDPLSHTQPKQHTLGIDEGTSKCPCSLTRDGLSG